MAESVTKYITPAEAIKEVCRFRKGVARFISTNMELITDPPNEAGEYRSAKYPYNLRVSVAEMSKYLAEMHETATRLKGVKGWDCRVRVSWHGNCVFVG